MLYCYDFSFSKRGGGCSFSSSAAWNTPWKGSLMANVDNMEQLPLSHAPPLIPDVIKNGRNSVKKTPARPFDGDDSVLPILLLLLLLLFKEKPAKNVTKTVPTGFFFEWNPVTHWNSAFVLPSFTEFHGKVESSCLKLLYSWFVRLNMFYRVFLSILSGEPRFTVLYRVLPSLFLASRYLTRQPFLLSFSLFRPRFTEFYLVFISNSPFPASNSIIKSA